MKIAIYLNLIIVFVFISTSNAQIKLPEEEFDKSIQYISNNTESKPYWSCFFHGLNMSTGEIAEASPNQSFYYYNLLARGGFTAIGERVRQTCNKALGYAGDRNASKITKLANHLFMAFLLGEDFKLFASCQAQKGKEWEVTKDFCARSQARFESRLSAP